MESTMLAQVKLCACAALVTITIVGPSYAQTLEQSYDDPMLPVIEIAKQSHEFSGIEYPASAAAESLTGRTRYMEAMLTEIATWLSTEFRSTRNPGSAAHRICVADEAWSMLYGDQWREDTMSGPTMQAALTRERHT